MMPFEYLNNSFSVAISIFTLIFGMAYPLLQEFVQRIEDKYVEPKLTKKFKSETEYILFNWLILTCMVEAVICPLLIQVWNNGWWTYGVIAFQLISVFCLMLDVVLLVQLILDYYDANQLYELINKHDDNSELPNMLCICKYASKHDLEELYGKGMSFIFKFIAEEQKQTAEKTAVVYSPEVNHCIQNILRLSYKEKGSYFYERNDVVSMLLNHATERYVSEQTSLLLRVTLNHIVHVDNYEWFKQYWAIAYQDYMFHLSNLRDDYCQDEKKSFEDMHIMMGGLLCFHKKYEWLEYILFFSNTMPPSYPLIPSNATSIERALYDIERKREDPFQFVHLAKYRFIGLKNDVSDISTVVKYVEKYLALLIIRLWSVDNYNYTFSEPMEFSPSTDDLDDNDKRVKDIQKLISNVRCWFVDKEIEKVHLPVLPHRMEVLDLLSKQIKNLKRTNAELTERGEIDESKLEIIKREIITSLSKKVLNIPQGIHHENKEYITIPIYATGAMDADAFIKGRHVSIVGMGDALAEILNANTKMAYGRQLLSNRYMRRTSQVRYQDILTAIDKLKIDSSYVVLSLGVYLDMLDILHGHPKIQKTYDGRMFYGDVEIVFIDSRQSSLIVMKREELPYYEYVAWDSPVTGMEEINHEMYLYSNISHVDRSSVYLKFARVLKMESNIKSSFACLQVNLNEISDEMDLNTIGPLPDGS